MMTHLKPGRKIALKNRHLRTLRKNLRIILFLAYNEKTKRYHEKVSEIDKEEDNWYREHLHTIELSGNEDLIREFKQTHDYPSSPFQDEKYRQIQEERARLEREVNISRLREARYRSTLGCGQGGLCLTYEALIAKKIRKGLPKFTPSYDTLSPNLTEYLSLDEIMDIDLVYAEVSYPKRWVCSLCYKEVFKPIEGLHPCDVDD